MHTPEYYYVAALKNALKGDLEKAVSFREKAESIEESKGYFYSDGVSESLPFIKEAVSTLLTSYDFTRCVRPNGTFYGTRGKCRKGSETGAREKASSKEVSKITDAQKEKIDRMMTVMGDRSRRAFIRNNRIKQLSDVVKRMKKGEIPENKEVKDYLAKLKKERAAALEKGKKVEEVRSKIEAKPRAILKKKTDAVESVAARLRESDRQPTPSQIRKFKTLVKAVEEDFKVLNRLDRYEPPSLGKWNSPIGWVTDRKSWGTADNLGAWTAGNLKTAKRLGRLTRQNFGVALADYSREELTSTLAYLRSKKTGTPAPEVPEASGKGSDRRLRRAIESELFDK